MHNYRHEDECRDCRPITLQVNSPQPSLKVKACSLNTLSQELNLAMVVSSVCVYHVICDRSSDGQRFVLR